MYFVRIAFWFAIFGASTVKYRITAPYYGNGPESYPRIVNGINPLEWVKNLAEREGFYTGPDSIRLTLILRELSIPACDFAILIGIPYSHSR
jgi:hypothetical protein